MASVTYSLMYLESLWSTWSSVSRLTRSAFLTETDWKSSWKGVEDAFGFLSRNGMWKTEQLLCQQDEVCCYVFLLVQTDWIEPVSSLHCCDYLVIFISSWHRWENVTIPHHGNLCAVEHDDVSTVPAPAQKQKHAAVSHYLWLDWTNKTIYL